MQECEQCRNPYPSHCRCIRILARGSGQWLPPLGECPNTWSYPNSRGDRPPSVSDAKKLAKLTSVWNADLWDMVWGKDRAMDRIRGKRNDGYRPTFIKETAKK
jgi:hypothetical protein